MKKIKLCVGVVLMGMVLSGCSSKSSTPEMSSTDEAMTSGAGGNYSLNAENLNQSMENQTVYFDFDSSQIKESYMQTLLSHADYLANNPNTKVRLEGHTDERGSREYNIALGERRAQAVAKVLYLSGVKPSQVSIVSYGKEKPLVQGHDESAWDQNRRAVVVYEHIALN